MRRIIATAAFTFASLGALTVAAQSTPAIPTPTRPSNPVFNPNTAGQPGPNDVRSSTQQPLPANQGFPGVGGAGGFGTGGFTGAGVGGAGGNNGSSFGGNNGSSFGGNNGSSFGGNNGSSFGGGTGNNNSGAGGAGGGFNPSSAGLVVPYGNVPVSPTPASTRKYNPMAPIDHSATAINHSSTAIDHSGNDFDGGF